MLPLDASAPAAALTRTSSPDSSSYDSSNPFDDAVMVDTDIPHDEAFASGMFKDQGQGQVETETKTKTKISNPSQTHGAKCPTSQRNSPSFSPQNGLPDSANNEDKNNKETDRRPLRRRLSLNLNLALTLGPFNLPSPPTKLRLLPRRWSGSSPPSQTAKSKSRTDDRYHAPQAKSELAPPVINPSLAQVPTPPASRMFVGVLSGFSSPVAADRSASSLNDPQGYSTSMAIDRNADKQGGQMDQQPHRDMAELRLSTASSLTAVDDDEQHFSQSQSTAPTQPAMLLPSHVAVVSRRPPYPSRSASVADDLAVLSEVDESIDHHADHADRHHHRPNDQGTEEVLKPVAQLRPRISTNNSSSSASASACSGIWLCSPPSRSPTSPLLERNQSHNSLASLASTSVPAPARAPAMVKRRPLVVRSMSTGRLAREFDEHGRIICLSAHSERVLQGQGQRATTWKEREKKGRPTCWKSASASVKLDRAQSYRSYQGNSAPSSPRNGMPSSPISPIPIMRETRAPYHPRRTTTETYTFEAEKKRTESRPVPSSAMVPGLKRTMSAGSWKNRGAWFTSSRSVRV